MYRTYCLKSSFTATTEGRYKARYQSYFCVDHKHYGETSAAALRCFRSFLLLPPLLIFSSALIQVNTVCSMRLLAALRM